MKFLLPAAMTLCMATAACAQTTSQAVLGPGNGTPSYADTRKIDQNTVIPPNDGNGTATAPSATNIGNSNWRTSDGFNNDPNNPSGAPGPSTIGTSPSR